MGEQIIALDSPILIYYLEDRKDFADRAEKIFLDIHQGKLSAVFSSIGLIEVLTGPKKLGRYDLAAQYRETITSFPNLSVRGVNEHIVELASDLRARYSITTPDAIHLATGIDFGAEKFVTNDKNLQRVKEIRVEML